MGGCDFLKNIVTPQALASCNTNPLVLVSLLGTILGCISMIVLVWYIHYITEKNIGRKRDPKKPGLVQKIKSMV